MMPREIKNHGSKIYLVGGDEPSVIIARDVDGEPRIRIGLDSAPLVEVETLISAWKLRQKDGR